MEYRYLGNSGLQVSAISLGSWVTFHFQAGVDKAVELMSAAYDSGVSFFDSADGDCLVPEKSQYEHGHHGRQQGGAGP